MRTQISFTSDLFESKGIRPGPIDQRRYGEDVGLWLAKAANDGEFTFGVPFQEEHGWAVDVASNSEKFKVGFVIMDDSIGDDQAEWHITVDKVRGWASFGGKDSPARNRLCDLIQNVLRDRAHIREIRWED